jgi:hypothetical protein
MAFTAHEVMPAPEGSYDVWKYIGEYRVRYRCTTNSADDGPQKAIEYAENHIARLGDTYAEGNDARPTAWLRTWEAQREANSLEHWILTAVYRDEEVNEDDNRLDDSGQPTDNPTDIRPEVEVQTVQYTRPVEAAKYLSGWDPAKRAHAMVNDGKLRPICNSALATFDPPPEADDARWTIRVKRNVKSIDCDQVKTNCVNSVAVTFQYRGIKKSVAAYCGKLRDFQAQPRHHHQYGDYVEVTLFFDVYDLSDGTWRLRILDQGFSARAMEGDPDGHGGVIYNDSRAMVAELCPQRRLIDSEGQPISEPVLLDGDGQPLNRWDDPANPKDPVYSLWQYYTEDNWKAWPILSGVVLP